MYDLESFKTGYLEGFHDSLAFGKTVLHCPQKGRERDDQYPSGYVWGWHSGQDILRGEVRRFDVFTSLTIKAPPMIGNETPSYQPYNLQVVRAVGLACFPSGAVRITPARSDEPLRGGGILVSVLGVPPPVASSLVRDKYQSCLIRWKPNTMAYDRRLAWRSLCRCPHLKPIDPCLSPHLDTTGPAYSDPNLTAIVLPRRHGHPNPVRDER